MGNSWKCKGADPLLRSCSIFQSRSCRHMHGLRKREESARPPAGGLRLDREGLLKTAGAMRLRRLGGLNDEVDGNKLRRMGIGRE